MTALLRAMLCCPLLAQAEATIAPADGSEPELIWCGLSISGVVGLTIERTATAFGADSREATLLKQLAKEAKIRW